MCGIVGLAGFRDDLLVRRMSKRILHRGPDDSGFYYSDSHSLGMQRLSIIDLENGHQPMTAAENEVALVFNGEIYNFAEIRDILHEKGHTFSTRSDTEVILKGYLEWGIDVVEKLNGMFAFAISDQRAKPRLYVVRDRIGIKPLYYHFSDNKLTFASELKAVLENRQVPRSLNPAAVDQFLRLRYVPGEQTLLKSVFELPAAAILEFSDNEIKIRKYWCPEFSATKPPISEVEAEELVAEKLETAVRRRLIADVPVGAYLSGGVDSSVLVAMMAKHHPGPIKTFSVGFKSHHDETDLARETARILGTDHTEILCDDRDFENLDRIVWHLDAPIGDAIVLPMFLLAQQARKSVKVVLSGEGGDEIFGGYLFHKTLLLASRFKAPLLFPVRKTGIAALNLLPHQIINRGFDYPADLGKQGKQRLVAFLKALDNNGIASQYRHLISLFSEEELARSYHPVFKTQLCAHPPYVHDEVDASISPLDQILSVQYRDWLPDDILMKLDKMTMAHSLEGRVPYLDHELVDCVNHLPDRMKIRLWTDKWILRKIAEKIVPRSTAERKKMPFYIPVNEYFQKPTFTRIFEQFREENYLDRILTAEYLDTLRLEGSGILVTKQLFSLIILNSWLKQFINQGQHEVNSAEC